MSADWPFPGSRWWKFDFHTHTPASKDTRAWQEAIGTENEVTPATWLLKYMAAGIDCVVVTDHNSGEWVDKLKEAYSTMQENPPEGFREITIFPGVELSVNGGIHLLAVFDTTAATGDINDLLAVVEYKGTKGDSDGVTNKTIREVIDIVLEHGGIPIPAHADKDKGLLQCEGESSASKQDASTIKAALAAPGLLAMEWCSEESEYPECVKIEAGKLAKVLGSDCHNFRGNKAPGSAFTWVKMASPPSLEGLRLALMDGGKFSLYRSNQCNFQPFELPDQVLTKLTIQEMRLMGRNKPQEFSFSPYFNAVVGGRGTGKSTLVHGIRLAARRTKELEQLGDKSLPLQSFNSFTQIANNRQMQGGLKSDTKITLEWLQNGVKTRMHWHHDYDGQPQIDTWQQGEWVPSESQSITAERFPIRVFSQGQIAALAGEGKRSLLGIIDQAAGVAELEQKLEEARRVYRVQTAQLREMQGRLGDKAETKRQLDEAKIKAQAFQQSNHAEMYATFSKSQFQKREVDRTFEQLLEKAQQLQAFTEELYLDDWPSQYFSEDAAGIVEWREKLDAQLARARDVLLAQSEALRKLAKSAKQGEAFSAWQTRVNTIKSNYQELLRKLEVQGITNVQQHSEQVSLVNRLQARLAQIEQLEVDCEAQQRQVNTQYQLIQTYRENITKQRKEFLQGTLANNPHVQIEVKAFGFSEQYLEQQLRELLDIEDGRFEEAIAKYDENSALVGGLLHYLVAQPGMAGVKAVKRAILQGALELDGRFRNYLARKLQQTDFIDRVNLWFPEDDLDVKYKRGREWAAIDSGSQGQRSAAMLAFLLAFGTEPIVLDQPEDDLDNQLIYELIVKQIKENKARRQLIIITHNPNIVVNGDAELVHVMGFRGQCVLKESGALQQQNLREAVCNVMEGGYEAFSNRWQRLGAKQ